MRYRRSLMFVLLTIVSMSAAARDTRKELTINLRFSPQEGVHSSSPDLTPAVLERTLSVKVEDARGGENPLDVGKGTNDDDQTFAIRASTDPIAYVAETLDQVATSWGVKTADKADRVLTLRLMRFFVDESNKAVGSVYAAEVKVTFVLADAAGKKLFEGATSGSAHRYGRARSADNCNEVLSDALKEAFANVLSDERVQQAWSSGQPGAAQPSGNAESIEERLRKLDELLKKGLITKDEYDRKRAEILKEI
jgi:uncharacterized lipoprotein YajG